MPYVVVARKLVGKGEEKTIGWYRTKKEAEADAKALISPWFTYKIIRIGKTNPHKNLIPKGTPLIMKDIYRLKKGMTVVAGDDIDLVRGFVPKGTKGKINYVITHGPYRGVGVTFENGVRGGPFSPDYLVKVNPILETIGSGLGLGAGFAVAHKVIDKVWKNPISETAKMLKLNITESDMKMLRPALGTEKVGEVLRDICRRRGLRNTLLVHSALIELTHYKLPETMLKNPKYPRVSKLRKPYKSTVFFPKTGKSVECWVVGRIWHKELYESPYSKDLVQLPSGEVVEV